MVIKNPYNFVTKHFKLINLLLLIPLVYLFLAFKDVSTFFKDYIDAGYKTVETNFADSYVSTLMMVALIGTSIICMTIYVILLSKKKKHFTYLFIALYSLVLIVLAWLFHASMMKIATIEPTFANFVRDMAGLCYLPFYYFLLAILAKAVGFNIKTLRFDGNSDLKLREEEDEDVEIVIGGENIAVQRKFIHTLRELKYYYLENKFVFSCIFALLGGIVLFSGYLTFKAFHQSLNVNQAFSIDKIVISLKDSYISNVDYSGKPIANDTYFLAIKIGLQNNGPDMTIDRGVFRIFIGDEVLYPTYDRASRFIDIGAIYQGQTIKSGTGNDFVFVYELSKKQVKNTYQLRILTDLRQEDGKLKKKYRKLNVKPVNITKQEDLGTVKKGQEIQLKNTNLGKTTYKLKNIEFTDSYQYEQKICDYVDACHNVKNRLVATPGTTLAVISDKITLDETTSYYKNSLRDFYGDFVNIVFLPVESLDNPHPKEITTTLKNVTPAGYTEKKIYEVPMSIQTADEISMVIHIRNKYITIIVKD